MSTEVATSWICLKPKSMPLAIENNLIGTPWVFPGVAVFPGRPFVGFTWSCYWKVITDLRPLGSISVIVELDLLLPVQMRSAPDTQSSFSVRVLNISYCDRTCVFIEESGMQLEWLDACFTINTHVCFSTLPVSFAEFYKFSSLLQTPNEQLLVSMI